MVGKNAEREWHASKIDQYKAMHDYLKHLSIMSAGSVLFVATFLEKLFAHPQSPILVTWSVGSFLVSLFAATISYGLFVLNVPWRGAEPVGKHEAAWMVGALAMAAIAFLLGVVALGLFFILNWNR